MTRTARVGPYGGVAGDAVLRGRDERGWAMIDVYPSRKPRAIYTEIDGKPQELCSQSKEIMRVYVNPEKEGFDEWEKPPGCGTRMYIRMSSPDMDPQQNDDEPTGPTESPDMDPQQNDDEPTGPTENDWEKDTTGKRRKLA